MSRSVATLVPLDLLRRQAIALGTAAGLPAPRAADLAHHVLWYEMLGASVFGLRCLAPWLADRSGTVVDLASAGHLTDERTGTAKLDATRTLPPLAMSQAVAIAAEKARENGVSAIQVANLMAPCPAGDAAAREALGPVAVTILTARPAWVAAIPSAGDLPFLADSDLDTKPSAARSRRSAVPAWAETVAPVLAGFAPEPGGAIVLALHVPALDSLLALRDRLAPATRRENGWLTPAKLAALRHDAEERGLPIAPDLRSDLDRLASQLGLPALDA